MAIVVQTAGAPAANTCANGDTYKVLEGGQNIDDFSGFTATTLANIFVGKDYTGVIGSGTNFSPAVTTLFTYQAGGGACIFAPTGATVARLKCIGNGIFAANSGTYTLLEVGSGAFRAGAAAVCQTVRGFGGTLTFQATSTLTNHFQTAIFANCEVNSERGLDSDAGSHTMTIGQGAVVNIGKLTSGTGGAISGLIPSAATGTIIVDGGFLTWRGGGIALLDVRAGAVDLSRVPSDMTIDALRISGRAMRQSKLKSMFATITISSTTIYADESDTLVA